ncbi:MAG: hypothetical protein ACFB5Z_08905 [Elainellaceae cyanobacterium]
MSTHSVVGVIRAGHGVASGKSNSSPYPRGTISMQRPIFKALGLDLAGLFEGTLNVSIEPHSYRVVAPEWTFRRVTWTDRHPPEDFSFSRCRVAVGGGIHEGLIYYPHPETKQRNFQDASTLEVIAPLIPGLHPGAAVRIDYNSLEIEVYSKPISQLEPQ